MGVLLVVFQGWFARKTFSTVSKHTLEWLRFGFPAVFLMKVKGHLIGKRFLAIFTAKALGYHWCWVFLLQMFFHVIFSSKGNWTMWTGNTVIWCTAAFDVSMKIGWMLDANTTFGTLLWSHSWIQTQRPLWRLRDVIRSRHWNRMESALGSGLLYFYFRTSSKRFKAVWGELVYVNKTYTNNFH